jgi:hypothetical protein
MRITDCCQAAACAFVVVVCALVTPAMSADPAPKETSMPEFRGQSRAPAAAPLSLWYRAPAAQWVEALPIGNGRLGAMVFGGVSSERIALNESTLWSGTPVGRAAPQAAHLMPQIRAAVLARDFAKAGELVRKQQGPWTEAYMPLGDLLLEFANAPNVVD